MKSWKIPTPEQINKAVALLAHAEQYRYFFDRLENPEWIMPLKNKKFFTNPPKPERDEVRGTIGFPPWPESRYLVRMAALKPDTVLEILLQIPDTDNVRVYEDMTDAALKMPASLASQLVEKAKKWARSPYPMLLPEKLGEFIAHLARGGQNAPALALAKVLLEVLPDPKSKIEPETQDTYSFPPEPTARFQDWDYEQILKKDIPELLNATKIKGLELLIELLDTAIRLSQSRDDVQDQEDYSYVWRPVIETHDQHLSHGIKEILATAVLDAAERLVQIDNSTITDIIRMLEEHRWKIYRRIELHLLRLYGSNVPHIVAEKLSGRSLFDDDSLRHEYALLLGEYFNKLLPEQQKVILRWIEQGPDMTELEESWGKRPKMRPTDEEVVRYQKTWRRDRLACIKDQLSPEWKASYQSLVVEYGEPEQPDYVRSDTTWVGPTSPKSADDLQKMTTTEIVQFLKEWAQPDEHFAPSPEGLGRALSSVISQDPSRFASEAALLRDIEPTYVRAVVWGLHEALKQGRVFGWHPVLELCLWVVNQPRETSLPQRKTRRDADPDWGRTRENIADLISAGFEKGDGNIPYNERKTVWRILQPITDDPDPTKEHEARFGGSNMDPATFSINTTRGRAMHAIIRYALWVRRNIEQGPDVAQHISPGFEEMPEARDVLVKHLDESYDPSLAVRAVYGQWFPWLVLLDPTWASHHVSAIFPIDEARAAFRSAAWDTYIALCKPYDNVFTVLSEQYSITIDRLGSPRAGKVFANPDQCLAEHLMTFYWRGMLDLENPEGLLQRFWLKSKPALRGHALEFIGRSLTQTKEPVRPDILERMKMLWEKRLTIAKQSSTQADYRDEMAVFGWWFKSNKLDDTWAVTQLIEALRISGKVKQERLVVKKLAELVKTMPIEIVACLGLIVKGDTESWGGYNWRDNAKVILIEALRTEAAAAAQDLIHYLGSRGYIEYRDLLRKQ